MGSGDSSVVEPQTRDRKVSGSSLGISDGRISLLYGQLSVLTLTFYFGIRSTSVLLQ